MRGNPHFKGFSFFESLLKWEPPKGITNKETQMNHHTLHIYTDESHFFTKGEDSFINVYWKSDFNRELDMYFHKKKYKHDFSMFRNGVGRLEIRFFRAPDKLKSEHIAYIETLAAKHIVSNSGINAFGYSDDNQSIRRDQLHIEVSNPESVNLIDRKGVDQEFFNRFSALAALSSPAAGYLYGASASMSTDKSWVDSYLKEDSVFENYNKAVDINIISNDYFQTALGKMIVDYRSVEEWMNSELMKFQLEVEGAIVPRPYQAVLEGLKKMTNIVYKNSKMLDKMREKFGHDCLMLTDDDHLLMIQVMPIDPSNNIYKVLGVRHHIPIAKLERMQAHGFALDITLDAPKEVLEASRARYESGLKRTALARENSKKHRK